MANGLNTKKKCSIFIVPNVKNKRSNGMREEIDNEWGEDTFKITITKLNK